MGKGNNKYLLMICSSCLKKLPIYMACSFSIGLESSSNFLDMWFSSCSNLINIWFG